MKDVLVNLQQYVPIKSETDQLVDPDDGEPVEITTDHFHYILFGGDQLTVERATGAKRTRSNESRGVDRLDGLVPVIEDWHSKVIFLKVRFNMLLEVIAITVMTCMHSSSMTV